MKALLPPGATDRVVGELVDLGEVAHARVVADVGQGHGAHLGIDLGEAQLPLPRVSVGLFRVVLVLFMEDVGHF